MTRATVYTPLRLERAALRRAPATLRVVRTGMGPARAAAARAHAHAAIVAGVCGGLAAGLAPGDVVVASEVRGGEMVVPSPSAPLLAGALRRLGLRAHLGPIVSSRRLVTGPARAALAASGALAVDMESAWLAPSGRPFAVLRAVVDTADHPLWRPGTLARGMRGLRALSRALPAIDQWAAATGTREVLLGPAIARECDLVLVVRSGHPSTSQRPVDVAATQGASAYLVDDVGEVDLRWLAGVQRVGIMAGASAAPHLVDDLVHCLAGLGPVTVREPEFNREDVHFTLPREVS